MRTAVAVAVKAGCARWPPCWPAARAVSNAWNVIQPDPTHAAWMERVAAVTLFSAIPGRPAWARPACATPPPAPAVVMEIPACPVTRTRYADRPGCHVRAVNRVNSAATVCAPTARRCCVQTDVAPPISAIRAQKPRVASWATCARCAGSLERIAAGGTGSASAERDPPVAPDRRASTVHAPATLPHAPRVAARETPASLAPPPAAVWRAGSV